LAPYVGCCGTIYGIYQKPILAQKIGKKEELIQEGEYVYFLLILKAIIGSKI
jgi:hypothetical protein